MADAWQSAFVEVVPDFSNFRSTANRQMAGILGDAGDRGGVDGSKRFTSSFVGGMAGSATTIVAAIAGLGIGKAISATVSDGFSYAFGALNLAGQLEQSTGAVQAVFGEQSKFIEEFALSSTQNLGLTTNAYNELATVLGAQLKNGGTAIDEIAGKTSGLITLGADLAATFGGSTQEAVQALSSAFRGERDAIEKYGVSLTQATIDAKAAELGFAKVGGVLTTQATQAATMALIYDQTAAAQGRFAAESNTLTGQQNRLSAALEEAQTQLGLALLPSLTELFTVANQDLIPVLGQVIEQVGPTLSAALAESTPDIISLVKEFAPLAPQIAKVAGEALPLVIVALQLLNPLLMDGAKNTQALFTQFNSVIDLLQGDKTYAEVREDLFNLTGTVGSLSGSIYKLTDDWNASLQNVKQVTRSVVGDMFTNGQNFVTGFTNGITSQVGALTRNVRNVFEGIVGTVRDVLDINSPSRVMAQIGAYAGQGYNLGFEKELGSNSPSVDVFASRVTRIRPMKFDSADYGYNQSQNTPAFPSQVTLVDSSGALIGVMDVRIEQAFSGFDSGRSQGYTGF